MRRRMLVCDDIRSEKQITSNNLGKGLSVWAWEALIEKWEPDRARAFWIVSFFCALRLRLWSKSRVDHKSFHKTKRLLLLLWNTTLNTMSIAELYIENGIDPTDPNSMDDFLSRYEEYEISPVCIDVPSDYCARIERDFASRTAASSWPLNESELDYMGETRGWDKIYDIPSQPPMASYKKDGIRLNFWLSTGTVGSYLDHPRQGKTQLFRRQVSMSDASDIFRNPRQHTGKGYHTKKQQNNGNNVRQQGRKRKAGGQGVYMRRCASCGASKTNDQFSNNQRKRGASSKCKACV